MVDVKGPQFPKAVICYPAGVCLQTTKRLQAVFFYVRYAVFYRDLEEIMAERGANIDHATLDRRVVKFSPLYAANAQSRKRATANSWRMPSRDIALQCPAG